MQDDKINKIDEDQKKKYDKYVEQMNKVQTDYNDLKAKSNK